MECDIIELPAPAYDSVLFAEGTMVTGKPLTFLGKTSGAHLIIPWNGKDRIYARKELSPPAGWTMGFALNRGFEIGFGDSKTEEESVVSKVSVGVELHPGYLLIDAWLKDIKADKRWYVKVGWTVLWFGVV